MLVNGDSRSLCLAQDLVMLQRPVLISDPQDRAWAKLIAKERPRERVSPGMQSHRDAHCFVLAFRSAPQWLKNTCSTYALHQGRQKIF